jgi:hypothetical protein
MQTQLKKKLTETNTKTSPEGPKEPITKKIKQKLAQRKIVQIVPILEDDFNLYEKTSWRWILPSQPHKDLPECLKLLYDDEFFIDFNVSKEFGGFGTDEHITSSHLEEYQWIHNVLCHFFGTPLNTEDCIQGQIILATVYAHSSMVYKPYCKCHSFPV